MANAGDKARALWSRLGAGARVALLGGAALGIALVAWAALHFTATDYGVLFSDLSESSAAAIVEQLKARKTTYRLTDDGTAILVPTDQVHETRLALVTSGTPLTGGVGFEIFDQQGLGATEQSQRVAYQRALQGELARTIGALEHVKQARVHLVLPESSLFKRDVHEPRAAVTLQLKPGSALTREQISGVQRLVAASVAGLDSAQVVVVDQRGIALSGAAGLDSKAGVGEARLQTKLDVEDYLTHKLVALLDDAYGPGQATVSVDATLNFDEIRRTVQDLLPVRAAGGDGKVLPRLQVNSGVSYQDPTWAIDTKAPETGAHSGTSSMRVEYEYGRRIEEIVGAPGGIVRLSIGVIVPAAADPEVQDRIRELVRVAAGIDEARGDVVVVRSPGQLGVRARESWPAADDVSGPFALGANANVAEPATESASGRSANPFGVVSWLAFGAVSALLLAASYALWRTRAGRALTPAERERLLADIRHAFGDDRAVDGEMKP